MLPRYTDANGKKKVAGGPGLKQTQLYTAEFGRAIAAWWRAHGPVSAGTGSFALQADNVASCVFFGQSSRMFACLWWNRNSKAMHRLHQEGEEAMVSCSKRRSVSRCNQGQPRFRLCGPHNMFKLSWSRFENQSPLHKFFCSISIQCQSTWLRPAIWGNLHLFSELYWMHICESTEVF